MDPIETLICCLFPRIKRRYGKDAGKKTRMERRRERMRNICRLQVSRSYQLMRDRILGRITFDYTRILIVWSVQDELPRNFVINALQKYGELTHIQDRWSVADSGVRIWQGVLVEFAKRMNAERASLDLPSQFKHLRSTMLETVISTLADCELLCPSYREGNTKVVIRRKVALRHEEIDDLHKTLSTYGPMVTFYANNRPTTIGCFYEVTYTYLTQAYLAMIMTNGLMYSRGILSAVIEKTQKDREILADAQDCIILLSQCYFPN